MTEEEVGTRRRPIPQLSCDEARAFLLKQESYCTIELPQYFQFNDLLLNDVANVLEGRCLSNFWHHSPKKCEDVNYRILNNKDGRYAWRPFELIHPVVYVSLVNHITERGQWKRICERFYEFEKKSPKIKCLGLPVESRGGEKDKPKPLS